MWKENQEGHGKNSSSESCHRRLSVDAKTLTSKGIRWVIQEPNMSGCTLGEQI